jgi:hypothetical protein
MISRFFRIASLALLLTMLAGCATAIATAYHGPSKQKVRTQVMSDEVVAIARPKQSEQQVNNPNGLVMIGLNHSYHITNGSEFIEKLTNLDAAAISINNHRDIEFVLRDTKFSGVISVSYMKEHYTYEELSLLKELKFTSHIKKVGGKSYDAYSATIQVAGDIYAKYQGDEVSSLSKGRKVKFSTESYETKFNGELLFHLPFAIAFDVVTAPIQAVLLVGIVASTSPTR